MSVERNRLVSLIEFSQQSARLRGKPVASVSAHGIFAHYEHEIQGLPGIVRSRDASEIARFVGKRTAEIEELCRTNEVLAILFRMVKATEPSYIRLQTPKKNSVLKGQPQSITELNETAIQWLRQHIGM